MSKHRCYKSTLAPLLIAACLSGFSCLWGISGEAKADAHFANAPVAAPSDAVTR